MKADYKFLKDLLETYVKNEGKELDPEMVDLHREWFKACFCEVGGQTAISLRGFSVYKFLTVVSDEILAEVEPEGLYDLVNFWLIKKAEVLVNKLQDSEGVLN